MHYNRKYIQPSTKYFFPRSWTWIWSHKGNKITTLGRGSFYTYSLDDIIQSHGLKSLYMLLIPKIKCLSSPFPWITESIPFHTSSFVCQLTNKRTLGPPQDRLLSQHALSQPTAPNGGIALDSPSHPHIQSIRWAHWPFFLPFLLLLRIQATQTSLLTYIITGLVSVLDRSS